MEAVGVEDFLVRALGGNSEGGFIHNNDVRTKWMKRAYEKTSPHSQIGQTKHEASSMLTQKPFDRMLHKFKDVSQVIAAVKFLDEILSSFVVQTLDAPRGQYVDRKRTIKSCEQTTLIHSSKEYSIVARLMGDKYFERPASPKAGILELRRV